MTRPRLSPWYWLRLPLCPLLVAGTLLAIEEELPAQARLGMSAAELDAYARTVSAPEYRCQDEAWGASIRVGLFTIHCTERSAEDGVTLYTGDYSKLLGMTWCLTPRGPGDDSRKSITVRAAGWELWTCPQSSF